VPKIKETVRSWVSLLSILLFVSGGCARNQKVKSHNRKYFSGECSYSLTHLAHRCDLVIGWENTSDDAELNPGEKIVRNGHWSTELECGSEAGACGIVVRCFCGPNH